MLKKGFILVLFAYLCAINQLAGQTNAADSLAEVMCLTKTTGCYKMPNGTKHETWLSPDNRLYIILWDKLRRCYYTIQVNSKC